jgi:hypothetical protein
MTEAPEIKGGEDEGEPEQQLLAEPESEVPHSEDGAAAEEGTEESTH